MSEREVCPKCGTSFEEILETGFVGCEKCYEMPQVKQAVNRLFGGKKHKAQVIRLKNNNEKTQMQPLEDFKLPPQKGHEKYGLDISDEKVEEYLADMRKYKQIKQKVEGQPVTSGKTEDNDDYYVLGI